ncbi:site-specific integrase [Polynucleobacter sp. MG-Unter2-18]|uniref:tyrosine-type recombinase/integrase n=1 Tax=Polynucleobacter sp. MG-Unter2-18 TaxID=2081052 RepID=UPI001BFCFDD5|nr:site-specific integrase [Polynucleobacter sp. MG-Unter2-18]QWD95054.1 site-specific integrase [Polynucleobacter sp. MG-Unter2-18]
MKFSSLAQFALGHADTRLKARIRYWIEFMGEKDISEITSEDVDAGIELMARRGKLRQLPGGIWAKSGEPLAAGTLNRHISALGHIYKLGKSQRIIPKSTISPTKGVEKAREGPGRIINLSRDQIDHIIDASRLMRWRKFTAMICVAMTSGARLGNLQTMTWRDVDLERGSVHFPTSKNGKPYSAAISSQAVIELKNIKRDLDTSDTLVFGNRSFRKSWARTLKLAGVEYFAFHGCRHICASMLAASGMQLAGLMAQLNHSSPKMAMRYSHLNVDHLREGVARAWG